MLALRRVSVGQGRLVQLLNSSHTETQSNRTEPSLILSPNSPCENAQMGKHTALSSANIVLPSSEAYDRGTAAVFAQKRWDLTTWVTTTSPAPRVAPD